MLKSIKINHSGIYFVVLSLAIISLPLSRFSLSVAQFALIGNWILEGDFRRKLNDLRQNKAAIVLISLFVFHIAGLIYTTDFVYAFKDIRIKLPLLVFPVIFATTKPPKTDKINILLLLFVGASLTASFISFGIYLTNEFNDIRDVSPFISHIRLSLNICIAIFISGYFLMSNKSAGSISKLLFVVAMVWMVCFLILIESVTGIFILVTTFLALLALNIFKAKSMYKIISILVLLIGIPFCIGVYVYNVSHTYRNPDMGDIKTLDIKTENGNLYEHDTILLPVENGNYIGLYVCEKELRQSWNIRSELDFDGKDERNQSLKSTMIRYLNSKGLRKDKSGIEQLSEKDISNIEKGIANYYYTKKLSINSRLYKILWEYEIYKRGYNPGGHSIIQRLEFWKISLKLIRKNFWFGVGTGDIDQAFKDQYIKSNSALEPQWQHRAHNQYLATFVTFGIIGFLWFLFTLIYPALRLRLFSEYLYFVFIIVLVLSMFVEDTLETQMGVSLFAFFNSFLLFCRGNRSENPV